MKARKATRYGILVLSFAAAFAMTACDSASGPAPSAVTPTADASTPSTPTGGSNVADPTGTQTAAPSDPAPAAAILPNTPANLPTREFSTDFLVFTGPGTWSTEINDAEALITAHGKTYQEASAAQLDAMSADDMAKFGVLFFPGGAGGTEAASVSSTTHANLRKAVQELGVSYLGFCAGAWIAVAPAPKAGGDVSYGFGVYNGAVLDEYTGPGTSSEYGEVAHSFPDGTTKNILWYGGPVTPNTGVLAKYPTGEPAISEMWSGNGFVMIGGTHPTISQSSLGSMGVSGTTASDYAWTLYQAALDRQPIAAIYK